MTFCPSSLIAKSLSQHVIYTVIVMLYDIAQTSKPIPSRSVRPKHTSKMKTQTIWASLAFLLKARAQCPPHGSLCSHLDHYDGDVNEFPCYREDKSNPHFYYMCWGSGSWHMPCSQLEKHEDWVPEWQCQAINDNGGTCNQTEIDMLIGPQQLWDHENLGCSRQIPACIWGLDDPANWGVAVVDKDHVFLEDEYIAPSSFVEDIGNNQKILWGFLQV